MMFTPSALLPPNEGKRLAALQTYHILHSLREPLFTELVELAATLFNVPISLIALVGADEVEYIATHGLPGLRSQPRVEAICSMPVKQQQAVVFLDLAADTDSLTAEARAAALAKGLRFYAGVPLCMPDRQCIGTLCLIDQQPRTFSAPEQQVLEQLARLAGQLIAVRHYCITSPAKGVEYWCLMRSELAEEVRALLVSVQQLIGYAGTRIPVSASVLEAIHGQLHELYWRLTDYYPASAPG
jgi:transcriptional regulator with GAF, ATPase, and Fis domain